MRGYDRLTLGYVAAVTLAAALLVAWLVEQDQPTWSAQRLALAVVFAALVVLSTRYELQLGPRVRVAVDTVWLFAALLLLGPALAAFVGAVGSAVGDRLNRRDLVNCWFDGAQVACSLAVAGLGALALGQPFPLAENALQSPGTYGLLAVGAALLYFTNVSLVAGMVALDLRLPYVEVWRRERLRDLIQHIPLFIMGLVPALPLQLIAPMVVVYFALHDNLRLREAQRVLEEARRQREQFVSMVAHELRRPLTAIRAWSQLLERRALAPELQEQALATIVAETDRLARLVQDLVDTSHLASGQFQVNPGTWDLVAIAREQVELARPSSDRHTIGLEAEVVPLVVRVDRDRAAQVIANLLTNAITYTAGGRILVRLRAEGDRALLSVSDEGAGVPGDQLEAIFRPHVRLAGAHAAGAPEGMGLGLYIARGIVEAHGGRLWAESGPGRGTTFTLSLPLGGPKPAGVRVAARR